MITGWLKLHRKTKEWEWYRNSNMVHLFIHLIISANHQEGEWNGVKVLRGQIVTGINSLTKETGMSTRTIRTCLKNLQKTGEATIKTTNKYSIITLCKYDDYQIEIGESDKQSDKQKKGKKPTEKKPYNMLLLDEFCGSYQAHIGEEYVVINPGKESAAMGKLGSLYKKAHPDHNTEEALAGMRVFFDSCMQINDHWIQTNMSPSLIISKFNEIKKILKYGNQRKAGKNGASDTELAQLYARVYGVTK